MTPRETTGPQRDARAASAIPLQGRILAIDVGTKRIGVALSDPTQTLAQPLDTLTRRPGRRFPMGALRTHFDAHELVGVVVGLPLTPEAEDSALTTEVRSIAQAIEQKTGLPVILHDERMSTSRALGAVREMGGGTRGRREEIDQLAATVILQTFLDTRRR